MRPALSPEARESQLASLAHDLAEKQLRDGTASAQVISYFLRKGSEEERLKIEKLEEENRLLRAKTKALDNEGEYKKLVEDAINAIRGYQGQDESDESYDY
jgi:hypothetical protein